MWFENVLKSIDNHGVAFLAVACLTLTILGLVNYGIIQIIEALKKPKDEPTNTGKSSRNSE